MVEHSRAVKGIMTTSPAALGTDNAAEEVPPI
jgi:hypothetical protein